MKKLVKFLLAFVLVFSVVASFFAFTQVKAEPAASILTDENIVVQGAQIRKDDKEGMRFVASIKDYVAPEGKTVAKYGFALALGYAEASDDFVIEGVVNENSVITVALDELADETEKTYYLTIFNIPASSYGDTLSARAFVILDDDTVVYGAESSNRSLAQVVVEAIENGDDSDFAKDVQAAVAASYKKVFMDALGSFYVDEATNESNPMKIYAAFAADWNAFVKEEVLDPNAKREEVGPQLKAALDAESEFSADRDIVKFFRDKEYGAKWAFLLDLFANDGKTALPEQDTSLLAQVRAIRGVNPEDEEITKNDWYNCYNLISNMADYFAQNDYSAFPSPDITGIEWLNAKHDYRLFFANVWALNTGIVLASDAELVAVGDQVVLPAVEPKTGYEGYYVLGTSALDPKPTFEVGDKVDVTVNNDLYLREYRTIDYKIVYSNLEGATNDPLNPAIYTIETETITLKPATKTGYEFKGWFSDKEFTKEVTKIEKGSHGDVELFAKWQVIDYKITYELNGGTNAAANPATFTIEDKVTFANAVKDYYDFGGWYSEKEFVNKVTEIAKGTHEDQKVFAKFTPTVYTITYHENGSTNNPVVSAANPATYDVTVAVASFAEPTRAGYKFAGWFTDKEFTTEIKKIEVGSHGNLDLYAKWDLVEYKVEYVLGDGATNDPANPEKVTTETEFELKKATKPLYTFMGWFTEQEFVNEVKELKVTVADVKLYAKFEETKYKKYYVDFMGNVYLNGQVYESNPAELFKLFATDWNTFQTDDAKKINVEAAREEMGPQLKNALKASVVFDEEDDLVKFFNDAKLGVRWGWMLDMFNDAALTPAFEDPSLVQQIAAIRGTNPEISKNNWYYGANLITYMADFFSQTDYSAFPPTAANPLTGIVWRDADKGIDNRTFFANVLTYNDQVKCVEPDRKEETSKIELPDFPTPVGISPYYTYGGDEYKVGDEFVVTSTDVQFLIEFTYTDYTITYKNMTGATNDPANPATFTTETATFELKAASLTGYTFKGWYSDKELTTEVKKIEKGTHENVTVYAKWEAVGYKITYVLPAKAVNSANNPATFTIASEKITLEAATLDKYDFVAWYAEKEFVNKVESIAAGTHEDVTVYGKFVNYAINYVLNGGTNDEANPATYVKADEITLAPATKVGYDFEGWFTTDTFEAESEVKVVKGTTLADITLYAKFSGTPNEITFDYNDATTAAMIFGDFVTAVQAKSTAKPEYNALFLAKDENDYYCDYLPLKSALKDADFRDEWAWLFEAIADVHSTVSDTYTEAIKAFANAGIHNSDAIYVFCQEMKAYYNTTVDPTYEVVPFVNVKLETEGMYDWSTDPVGLYKKVETSSKTPDYVIVLGTGDTIADYVADPIFAGYVFKGWNTKADGTGDFVTKAPAEDATLYAIWE